MINVSSKSLFNSNRLKKFELTVVSEHDIMMLSLMTTACSFPSYFNLFHLNTHQISNIEMIFLKTINRWIQRWILSSIFNFNYWLSVLLRQNKKLNFLDGHLTIFLKENTNEQNQNTKIENRKNKLLHWILHQNNTDKIIDNLTMERWDDMNNTKTIKTKWLKLFYLKATTITTASCFWGCR